MASRLETHRQHETGPIDSYMSTEIKASYLHEQMLRAFITNSVPLRGIIAFVYLFNHDGMIVFVFVLSFCLFVCLFCFVF